MIGWNLLDPNTDQGFHLPFFGKQVLGAPLPANVSAYLLLYETLKLGVNYRWNDFISAQMCPELSTRLNTGYSDEYGVNELIELN